MTKRERSHESSGLSLPLKMPRPTGPLPSVNHEALEAAFMGRKPAYTPSGAPSAYTDASQPQAFSPKIGGSTPSED